MAGIITAEERRGNLAADRLASVAAAARGCPEDIVARAVSRKAHTFEIQRYLVEVLLSRRLYIIEHLTATAEVANSTPLASAVVPPSPAIVHSIKEAFLALHCF